MKIEQVLQAGYQPTLFGGMVIESFIADPHSGVIRITTIRGDTHHLSMDKEHDTFEIQWTLHVKFTEEMAASLLIANQIAPVAATDIDRGYLQTIDHIRNKLKASELKTRHERIDASMLFGHK